MEKYIYKYPTGSNNKASFLERDGTINIEKNYLYKFQDWEWIDGAIESIKILNKNNFIVISSNL